MHFGFGILLVVSTGIMPIEVGDMTIRHTYLNAMENCSKSEYQSLEVGLLKDPSKKHSFSNRSKSICNGCECGQVNG